MASISGALSRIAGRMIASPIDPIVAHSLVLGIVLMCSGIVVEIREALRRHFQANGARERRRMKTALVAVAIVAAASLLVGCSGVDGLVRREQARSTEAALAAAGFHIEPADTADRIRELEAMPASRVVPRNSGDEQVYAYADPVQCRCEYVGNADQYAQYQKQRRELLDTDREPEALDPWPSPWSW